MSRDGGQTWAQVGRGDNALIPYAGEFTVKDWEVTLTGLFKGATKTLVIPNATSDLPGMQAKLRAYFKANSKTDALLGLNPDVTVAALAAVPKGTKVGTFDLNGQVINSIKGGKVLFAIDQQQYLQGYLPVVFGYLFVTNLNTVGNGQPVLTGPGIVNKANAAKVEALAKAGTR